MCGLLRASPSSTSHTQVLKTFPKCCQAGCLNSEWNALRQVVVLGFKASCTDFCASSLAKYAGLQVYTDAGH